MTHNKIHFREADSKLVQFQRMAVLEQGVAACGCTGVNGDRLIVFLRQKIVRIQLPVGDINAAVTGIKLDADTSLIYAFVST